MRICLPEQRTQAMRAISALFLAVGLVLSCPVASASNAADMDSATVVRLAGLCRLWGAVKFFHPYVADRGIDWDRALIQVIPKVVRAQNRAEYAAAVRGMLSSLGDPNTRILNGISGNPPSRIRHEQREQPYLVWTEDSLAVIVANEYAQFVGDENKPSQFEYLLSKTRGARGIVFDIRRRDDFDPWFPEDAASSCVQDVILRALPGLLQSDIITPGTRHLMHRGYVPPEGPIPDGFYSAFVCRHGVTIGAMGKEARDVPLAFVINEGSSVFMPLLGGLQAAGRAAVVYEGYFNQELGIESYDVTLPESLTVRIRIGELVKGDGSEGIHPDFVIPFTTDTTLLADPSITTAFDILAGRREIPRTVGQRLLPTVPVVREKAYEEMICPSKEYRLLCLFRLWNIIHCFHTDPAFTDQSWDSALTQFIPRFAAADDSLRYILTIAALTARIRDSQAAVQSPTFNQYIGPFYPPISVKSIDGEMMVSHVFENVPGRSSDVHPGDLVLAIDNEEVVDRRERLAALLSASIPAALESKADAALLGGRNGSTVKLKIMNADGTVFDITLLRTREGMAPSRDLPVTTVFSGDIGYIDLCRLQEADVDTMMQNACRTKGLILDLRGDVNKAVDYVIGYVIDHETAGALISIPERHTPDSHRFSYSTIIKTITPASGAHYQGKIAALIDETTVGRSELMGLCLKASADVVFVGSPTAGSSGPVTSTILPGGVVVTFAGAKARSAVGDQTVESGIQPDVEVKASRDAIRQGRDDVLDKAIEILRKDAGR